MNSSSISIIVPVYNGGEKWKRCLEALAEAQPAPGEIIVVDDGSTDDSAALARARGFTVLQTDKPQSGPAIARNLGAAHAQGEVLFFVDADVMIYPDTVGRVAAGISDPRFAAIMGSYDDTPEDNGFVSQYKNLMHHFVHQTSMEETSSFWAGCGAIRKDVFRLMGGFASCYRKPSIEDIELGYRLRAAGYHIRLVKDLQVKHLKRWTWRSLFVTDIFNRAIPWAGLLLCERKLPADLNLQTSHRVSTIICFFLPFTILGLLLSPLALALVVLAVVSLVALNQELYRFFLQKRGLFFAVRAMPLHWTYYIYSGLAFGVVLLLTTIYYRSYVLSLIFPSHGRPGTLESFQVSDTQE